MLRHPDILAVINGNKPLANFELRKHPEQFKQVTAHLPLVTKHVAVHPWNSPEGPEIVLAKDQESINQYLEILHNNKLSSNERALRLGRLFGYSEADIDAFVANPPDCNCSKCVGVTNARLGASRASVDRLLFQRFPKGK